MIPNFLAILLETTLLWGSLQLHSFILETYIALYWNNYSPAQQWPILKISESQRIYQDSPPAPNAAQMGHRSMLVNQQPKTSFPA